MTLKYDTQSKPFEKLYFSLYLFSISPHGITNTQRYTRIDRQTDLSVELVILFKVNKSGSFNTMCLRHLNKSKINFQRSSVRLKN